MASGTNIKALMEELRKKREATSAGLVQSTNVQSGSSADSGNSLSAIPVSSPVDKSSVSSGNAIGDSVLVSDLGSRGPVKPSDQTDSGINTVFKAPLPEADLVKARIFELQESLAAANPGYERQLHTIHTMLLKNQTLPTMLTAEEVGIVVRGLTKKANIIISEEKSKSKSLKSMGVDDI